ncbi:MAG: multidrug transporter ATP-binding protein [Conexibacter sp.]|jgi:ABC-2 type transport system ATP-binding protein|nr:multidrug transporter ATP-binding protein [Conexibacter sp.]MCZ4493360.1 multidrug transporter ATP-binding protein [Conexibacter sp.]MDX6716343.1 type transport system ATP-binding protein [Baekduia sp.]MDX6732323.1 type transport system ATP-binding protein [Baekduia sp.]
MRAVSRPAIETVGLQREFKGGLKAVAGIDLAVAPGEVYGFLGPNGAGKTTTVRMLVTLLRPTGGHATIAGFDVATQPGEVRRRIGVALQEAALDLLMTGRELMELQATLHGIPRRAVADRAALLIERVGLEQAAERRVATYSGGMRRRLDLAMALIHEPEVLFLDEPTTGLDPTSRATLWDEVRRLRDEGTTVFLTTQYLEEADQLADRVGIIDAGVLVAEGTPAALKAQVGAPHLDITLGGPEPDVEAARIAVGPIGELLTPGPGARGAQLSLRVAEGAAAIAPVVRALDEAGCVVEGIEVVRPTLDDVFAEQTGHHLEGAGEAQPVVPA